MEKLYLHWESSINDEQSNVELWDTMAEQYRFFAIPNIQNSQLLQIMDREGMLKSDAKVLDVGCGTGLYGIALSKYVYSVTGVDISPKMIEYGKQKIQENEADNVTLNCLDWEKADLPRFGWDAEFDLAFAYMTPAISNWQSFLKLIDASKRFGVFSMPIRRVDPVSDKVKELVGIEERRESSDDSLIYAFEMLYRMGYSPKVDYETQVWGMKKPIEQAYGLYINRVKTYRDISNEEETIIKDYLNSISENNSVQEVVHTSVATLFWDKQT
ncbi:MAG: methyltransferase domain-containing protein [Clostridiales bacterium]|jgi:SAM-dependent methyltransferase|nr:methyltransferase domain-containing protein [Clostridiales bacterium]